MNRTYVTESLTKVSILDKESIHVGQVWPDKITEDLLQNLKTDSKSDVKFALVTDTNIGRLYLNEFIESFEKERSRIKSKDVLLTYEILPGETSKSSDTVAAIHGWLADNGCTKDSVVIALGGGVCGDM